MPNYKLAVEEHEDSAVLAHLLGPYNGNIERDSRYTLQISVCGDNVLMYVFISAYVFLKTMARGNRLGLPLDEVSVHAVGDIVRILVWSEVITKFLYGVLKCIRTVFEVSLMAGAMLKMVISTWMMYAGVAEYLLRLW